MQRLLGKQLNRFHKDEDGGLAIFGLYMFLAMIVIGGIAVDVSNLIAARTQLQVTADLAAHAALYSRDTETADDSKLAALAVVEATMPRDTYGVVMTADDILFGTYDYDTDRFTADATSRKAVLISTSRLQENANPVSSFLLQFVGFWEWDVAVQSVFTTFRPSCFREGFVADGEVDIQSNNAFTNGFCIHSNTRVSMNSNNLFEAGTIVAMPDLNDFDMPTSGWDSNEGIGAALREGEYRLRIVNKLPTIIQGLANLDPEYLPSYIDTSLGLNYVTVRNGKGLSMANLAANQVNIVSCHNNGVLPINDGNKQVGFHAISNVVIVTACDIKFDQGLEIQDSIIATTSVDNKSITSPSSLLIGRDDNCSSGGDVQILTLGGVEFSSGVNIFGSQVIAVKDISFTANADGIHGASLIAGGVISGTSNMDMGFCGTGMENNFEAEYFRLAL